MALVALSAVVYGTVISIVSSRREAEFDSRLMAVKRQVRNVGLASASRWAPDAWRETEAALEEAAVASRRARSARWLPVDLSNANGLLSQAAATAREAERLANEREAEALATAVEAIAEANSVVERASSLSTVIEPTANSRLLAARSRLLLDQARRYHRAGEYELALTEATKASRTAQGVHGRAVVSAARYADAATLETWQQWAAQTIAWSRQTGRTALVVEKADHRLTVYEGGRAVATYPADLSFNWVAQKTHAGDGAVPEGRYRVTAKKSGGSTLYYKALLLDYPNEADRRAFGAARRSGQLARGAALGGLIEIHGEGGRGRDWTRGCVALTNAQLDQVFARASVGTPVTIVGTTEARSVDELLARNGPQSESTTQ